MRFFFFFLGGGGGFFLAVFFFCASTGSVSALIRHATQVLRGSTREFACRLAAGPGPRSERDEETPKSGQKIAPLARSLASANRNSWGARRRELMRSRGAGASSAFLVRVVEQQVEIRDVDGNAWIMSGEDVIGARAWIARSHSWIAAEASGSPPSADKPAACRSTTMARRGPKAASHRVIAPGRSPAKSATNSNASSPTACA